MLSLLDEIIGLYPLPVKPAPRHVHLITADTLVTMVVMIASSKPEEKETLVRLVMNFLAV